jgi:cytochrome c oxidase subunit 6a
LKKKRENKTAPRGIGGAAGFVFVPYSSNLTFPVFHSPLNTQFARSRIATAARPLLARRSMAAQTVPRFGTEETMKAEAIEQLRARVAAQKQVLAATHKSHDEELDEMYKWIRISFMVAAPIVALSLAKDIIFPDHPHRPDGELPEYMKIRNKSFPWECEDCDLFDLKCWRQCRAAK